MLTVGLALVAAGVLMLVVEAARTAHGMWTAGGLRGRFVFALETAVTPRTGATLLAASALGGAGAALGLVGLLA